MAHWLKGLLTNGMGGASLGRLGLLLTLGLACWKWAHGVDIPQGHLVTLLTFTGYQLTGKFRAVSKLKDVTFEPPEEGGGKR